MASNLPPLKEGVKRLVGKGISFPFSFSGKGRAKTLQVDDGLEKIKQSIHLILSTRIGERVMMPEYGSRLPELVFEAADDLTMDLLKYHTATALDRWEPRITITNIETIDTNTMERDYNTDNNTIGVIIHYIVNNTHSPDSYVYPFKLGTMPFENTISRDRELMGARLLRQARGQY